MTFKTLSTESIFQGRIFNLLQDLVRLPDGKQVRMDIVEHGGAVTLLPLDDQGFIWFVRQYRHASKQELLELPAGTLDEDEAPEVCAHREIREEIGMSAQHLQKIGEFYLAPGYSTEFMIVFLATGLSPDPLQADADEFISVEKIHLDQVFQRAETGEICDAKSLAALLLARPHLFKE
jgi:ADP-ribose pyrophosphatase